MKRQLGWVMLCALLALLFWPLSSHAQLIFNLNPAGQQGNQGTMLTFNATLENIGNDPLFLNGDNAFLNGNGLTLDTSPFFQNSPLSMNSGDIWTGDIFTVAIAQSVIPSDYVGSFTIVGGLDPAAQVDLATQNFLVTVSPTSAVPEPTSFAFFLVAGLSVGTLALSRLGRRK